MFIIELFIVIEFEKQSFPLITYYFAPGNGDVQIYSLVAANLFMKRILRC